MKKTPSTSTPAPLKSKAAPHTSKTPQARAGALPTSKAFRKLLCSTPNSEAQNGLWGPLENDLTAYYSLEPLTLEQEKTADPVTLFNHNIRFAMKIAVKEAIKSPRMSDEFKAGALRGLWHAAQNFKAGLIRDDVRFISYAVFSIKREMSSARGIGTIPGVTLPYFRIPRFFEFKNGGEHKRLSKKDRNIFAFLNGISTETAVTDGDAKSPLTVGDTLVDDRPTSRENATISDSFARCNEWMEASLTKTEAAVLRYRYGLTKEGPLLLHEIGALLGFTRQRVEQLEKRALRKLRRRAYSDAKHESKSL